MNTAFAVDDQGLSWRFAGLIPGSPPKEFRLPGLPETPVVGYDLPVFGRCLFKMEQDCPTGSHKDRAAIFQVSVARSKTAKGLIIPSSGNAAIAVAAAGAACSLPVYAFLAPGTQSGKVQAMAEYRPRLIFCQQPVNRARNASRRFGLPNLRPSRDENAVAGFMTLGFELAGQYAQEPFDSVFVFSTSGATLTGIARAFNRMLPDGHLEKLPELHAVQAGHASGLARLFDSRDLDQESTPDPRRPGFGGVSGSALYPELTAHLRNSHGSGWLIDDNEITAAKNILDEVGIVTSPEGWCSLAATRRWRESGGRGTPLIVLTGKQRSDPVSPPALDACEVCYAQTYSDVEKFIGRWHPIRS